MPHPLSPSSVETANLCRFKYLQDSEIKRTELGAPAAEAGSAVHKVIQLSKDSEAMSRQAIADIAPTLSIEARAIFEEIGVPKLGITWPEFPVEQEVQMALDHDGHRCGFDSPNAILRGVCDMKGRALSGGKAFYIWDWKTNHMIPPDDVLPFNQTLLYATLDCIPGVLIHAAPDCIGVLKPDIIICRICYVRYGAVRERVYTMADVEAAWKGVTALWDSLCQEKYWNPQICHLCQYCRHISICPAIQQQAKAGLRDQIVHTAEEGKEMANWMRAMKRQVERVEAQLRRYADANGEIPLGNGEFLGYWERKGLEWQSAEKAVKKCIELGVPRETIWKYMNFGTTLLGKITKDKTLAEEVKKLAEPTIETRFEIHKKGK